MSELIRRKIASARSKNSLVEAATGVSMAVGALVASITLGAMLDYWLDLSLVVRAILLSAYLGYAGFLTWKYALRPVVKAPDDEDIALRVEHIEPTFSSRLISSVQFATAIPDGASVSMARAMMRETEQMAEKIDFHRIVPMNRLGQFAGAALVMLMVAAALFTIGGATSSILVGRALLGSTRLPTRTQVTSVSGSFVVARGDDATLSARVEGYRPTSARAEIVYDAGQRQTLTLTPSPDDPSLYTGTLAAVQDSFAYTLRAYDGRTHEADHVRASIRPAVAQLECSVVYPKYTGLGVVKKPTSELSVLAGSLLRLGITANKPVASGTGVSARGNYLQVFTTEKTGGTVRLPLAVVRSSGNRSLTAEVPLPATTVGFSIHLVDEDGLESKDGAVYRVEMLADRPPTVRILVPDRKEVLVTRRSDLDLEYRAEDDYGLGAVNLCYKIDDGDEQIIKLPLETPRSTALRARYTWSIAKIPFPADKTPEGSMIEYWIEAADLNDATGPLKGQSEHYQARIVTREDKQKELLGRMGEQLTIMRSLTERQEETSRDLGAAIEKQHGSATQPGR
jgi:hypothetical protein